MEKKHILHMDQALVQAQKAFDAGEVPIGAVVIDAQGVCRGVGYNAVEATKTQTAHAEMQALREAAQHLGNWRLTGCVLYVTLEPCSMCFSAAWLSRVATIVYGASSPLFGYSHDVDHFISVSHARVPVIAGVQKDASQELLKRFFEKKRS